MKNIIIGTAGHVDHGKSALIRALTGIETDRLQEEQERGMSIELGFAYFDLPSGAHAGIVDVPGHERFIKNMLMGATGMDMVVLVVAADEGVMPQTREHFAILRLLDVKTGVVAVTKADLVEEEWLELVQEDIRDLVKGSFLQDAPMIPVSSITGTGLRELAAAMDEIAGRTPERIAAGPFRMPIDRVFSVPGFGTVVTGTLRSGVVRVGEPAELLPQQTQTRVRQIQVHGKKEESASAGLRVAINLAGIELSDASRGDVVVAGGSLAPTSMVDVRLEVVPGLERPVAHRSRIRFHTGAVEIMGRVALLDREEARPGESVLAQVRLEEPTAVGRGDRFVLRRYSPGILLGGGAILDPYPRRHRRNQAGLVEALLVKERGSTEDLLAQALLSAGPMALASEDLAARTGLPRGEVQEVIKRLAGRESPVVVTVGTRFAHRDHVQEVERRVLESLREYHRRQPLAAGAPREELRARCGRNMDVRVFNLCLSRMEAGGSVVQEGPLIRLTEHEVKLEGRQGQMAAAILDSYRKGGMNPPAVEETISAAGEGARPIFEVLVFRGDLVKIAEGVYLEREVVRKGIETAVELIRQQGKLTVSQLRDALGSSRKVMVPFMEYMDATRVTRRVGDERVIY